MAAAAAGVAALIMAAKRMHEKGYDKKAVKMLRDYAARLRAEAARLEKKAKKKLSGRAKSATKKKSKSTRRVAKRKK